MPKTNALSRKVENALWRDDLTGLEALPATLYIGLCKQSEPANAAGAGGEYDVGEWDTYTRQAISRSAAAMGALDTVPGNVGSVSFAAPSSGNPSVEPAGSYLVFDAPTGGTAQFYGPLKNPVTPVPGGSALSFSPGKYTHQEA